MTLAHPKPAKRGRKPRRPIARRGRVRRVRLADDSHRSRVKRANELWRWRIYAKEPGGVCPRCLVRPWHDAAHCWTKGAYPSMRFEIDNGAPLCRPCHRRIDSDHEAKTEFFRAYLGGDRYEMLRLRVISRAKTDLRLLIQLLQHEAQLPAIAQAIQAVRDMKARRAA